ncbi:MAG: hypothetical protein NUW01_10505, partial [Gemmatimonadaceae bacterium]|nr:hypothetical protein [Gemmatimonadaceae bacterium]
MADLGGFLIRFDEAQRSEFLREVRDLEEGFSDALSSADWPMKKWEVCGLLFEDDTVTHWALARRTHRFVTGKAKVEFTNVTKTNISLEAVEGGISARVRRNMVSARSGVGGRVPPATWRELKAAVGVVDGASLEILERLERLRDQSGVAIHRPGAEVVAQQRDATGLA